VKEETKRTWDVWIGALAPVVTVIGIVVGVLQFNAGEDHRRKTEIESIIQKDDLEFRRRLWLERLETYRSVAKMAGKIAAAPAGSERDKAMTEFEGAYWGAMALVEDKAVEQAMMDFHYEIHDQSAGWTRDPQRLQVRANALAMACRKSMEAGTPATLAAKP
jgi:hypothetical protein